jgi:hypothetical protein
MADDRLVIPDAGIRLPPMLRVRLLQRKTPLEVGYTLDLPGNQRRVV